MNELCRNIYKSARIRAGLKREPAAEELAIDVRTLDKYEAMDARPPEDVVRKMCLLYDTRRLGYLHVKSSPLGDCLPELPDTGIQGATLAMVGCMGDINAVLNDVVKIASEGNLSAADNPEWAQHKKRLQGLAGAILAMLFAEIDTERLPNQH